MLIRVLELVVIINIYTANLVYGEENKYEVGSSCSNDVCEILEISLRKEDGLNATYNDLINMSDLQDIRKAERHLLAFNKCRKSLFLPESNICLTGHNIGFYPKRIGNFPYIYSNGHGVCECSQYNVADGTSHGKVCDAAILAAIPETMLVRMFCEPRLKNWGYSESSVFAGLWNNIAVIYRSQLRNKDLPQISRNYLYMFAILNVAAKENIFGADTQNNIIEEVFKYSRESERIAKMKYVAVAVSSYYYNKYKDSMQSMCLYYSSKANDEMAQQVLRINTNLFGGNANEYLTELTDKVC